MAESNGIAKTEFGTYMPDRKPMDKEKRKLVMLQERHNKAYDNALKRFEDRRELYEENMRKTFMKIFDEYCTSTMQNRLQQHPDFGDI